MTRRDAPGRAWRDDLWVRVRERTLHALACGALEWIPTRSHVLRDDGIDFRVRELAERGGGPAAGARAGPDHDPFGPWEPDLFVADVSAGHICLLNKFCVVPHHILIVTRVFEEQSDPLGLADFEALWHGLAACDGLAFYNAGFVAGASQRHKHLQIVPLPLAAGSHGVPIEARLQGLGSLPISGEGAADLPFAHAIVSCRDWASLAPAEAAVRSLPCYRAMLERLVPGERSPVYNLLVTRRWMLLVPRRREAFESIGVNALGFAGALLVRSPEQLEQLRQIGPMRLLREVAHRPM